MAAVGPVTAVQAGLVGILAQAFAVNQGLIPPTRLIRRLKRFWPVELGIVTGLALVADGLGWLMWGVEIWRPAGFGDLPTPRSLCIVVPAVTPFALGVQLFFLGLRAGGARSQPARPAVRRRRAPPSGPVLGLEPAPWSPGWARALTVLVLAMALVWIRLLNHHRYLF